jgi:ssDNA-binding Zn-finger/Zn-ribbon topoisomerase 1
MNTGEVYSCPACGDQLKRVFSKKKSRHYWVCQNAEDVCGKWFADKNGIPRLRPVTKSDPDVSVKCPDCGSPMQKLTGAAHGDFYSCSRYPECKVTIDLQDDGSLAPPCPDEPEHGPMRRRKGVNGIFWSCRRYPECTATSEIETLAQRRRQHADTE